MQSIRVKHNVEMAHRLTETVGKCERIHGHSWDVILEIGGDVDQSGKLGGLEFGAVKNIFRSYLDANFDHSLLLNSEDNWARYELPGLQTMEGDPTTENFAKVIGKWARSEMGLSYQYRVIVWETRVNCATWEG